MAIIYSITIIKPTMRNITLWLAGDERPPTGSWLEFTDPATGKVSHMRVQDGQVSTRTLTPDTIVGPNGPAWGDESPERPGPNDVVACVVTEAHVAAHGARTTKNAGDNAVPAEAAQARKSRNPPVKTKAGTKAKTAGTKKRANSLK